MLDIIMKVIAMALIMYGGIGWFIAISLAMGINGEKSERQQNQLAGIGFIHFILLLIGITMMITVFVAVDLNK